MRLWLLNIALMLIGVIGFTMIFRVPPVAAIERSAPSWDGTQSQWINLPTGKKSLDIKDLSGRVVYLSLFQKW